MSQDTYFYLILASAVSMIISAVILLAIKIPQGEEKDKLRAAKRSLAIAFMVMGLVNLLQISADPEGGSDEVTWVATLVIGSAQAMLFTMTAMVFVRPSVVTARLVWTHAAAIVAADVVLFLSLVLLPPRVFFYVFLLGVAAYVTQMALYTRWYVASYREFRRQIENFYEEEQINRRLRWIQFVFWSALTIGVAAMLLFLGEPVIDMWMTPCMAAVYICYVFWFINYMMEAHVILPALYDGQQAERQVHGAVQSQTAGLRDSEVNTDKLKQWIQEKRYLNTDTSTKDIAAEVGMTVEQMHQHFRDVVGEEFRTWRIRKRVEEAKRLMAEHPDYPTAKVGLQSGFNDRSYFYQQFIRFTDMSVQDYRRQLAAG